MAKIRKASPWEKEWTALAKRERDWLHSNTQYKPPILTKLLEGKVPPKLQSTLDLAFTKAFGLIFEKGTPILEHTFSAKQLTKQHQVDQYIAQIQQGRKSLRTFSRRSGRSGALNLAVSGVEGVAFGILGVGLPDIPVFCALLLRSLYEMSCQFGCPYNTKEEQYFHLLLLEGAFSYGDELRNCIRALNTFIASPALPKNYDQKAQIVKTAQALSRQLLYMKFLQGLPIVGVAGGAYDVVCLDRVQRFARLKYQRRLLLREKPHNIILVKQPKPVS